MAESRLYLNVPFAEKDQAKALGVRWDPGRKKWYVPGDKGAEPFEKWKLESQPDGAPVPQTKPTGKPAKDGASTTIAITQPLDKQFVPYAGDEPPWD